MADEEDVAILRERALHARTIARSITDPVAMNGLLHYAEELEAKARELEEVPVLPEAAAIPSGEPPIARAGAALKVETPPENPGDSANDNSSPES
jgi:hypothetical protein